MKKYAVAAGAAVSGLATSAHAALPAAVDTYFTELQTDIGTLTGYAWVLVPLVFGALLMIKLFKKFGSKAT